MKFFGFATGLLAIIVLTTMPAGALPLEAHPPCHSMEAAGRSPLSAAAHATSDKSSCVIAECLYYCMAFSVEPALVSVPIDFAKITFFIIESNIEGLAVGPPKPPPRRRRL